MSQLMYGLETGNTEHASLQMQFFWKYMVGLKENKTLSGFGDGNHAETHDNQYAAKGNTGLDGEQIPLAFKQTMTFFNALTELEQALQDVIFDFISKQRMQKRDHIDFNHLNRHLSQAVYLDNGVIMFERMPANQMLIKTGEHDIVGMAAFVLRAIYKELLFLNETKPQWKLKPDALALIQDFEDKFHIVQDAKLFADWGHNGQGNGRHDSSRLRENLKAILTDIDEQTPFKTPDYEDYYDALHGVLFDGDCSIDSLMPAYHQAWEELCVYHLVESQSPKPTVAWCDFGSLSFYVELEEAFEKNDFKDFRENWEGCNTSEAANSSVIYKRPDLILKTKTDSAYIVYDFKHYDNDGIKSLLNFNEVNSSHSNKQSCDLKSLAFYARRVDQKVNPYGDNTQPITEKKLCFPVSSGCAKSANTNFFDYVCFETQKIMNDYIDDKTL